MIRLRKMEEKFLASIANAERSLKTADHLVYITFPLINEQKLLLKVLSELKTFAIHLINSILQYDYYNKRITLYTDAASNMRTFKEQCAKRYSISDKQVKSLLEVISLAELHKNSPFEFVKGDKIVIMSENMRVDTISLERVKEFLRDSKLAFESVKTKIKN